MIVQCTTCQARFRVADEKIGPRGVRVRCGKCKTLFLVRPRTEPAPAAAPASGIDLALDDPTPASKAVPLPGPSAPPPDPHAVPPPADDPFAPSPDDPFAQSFSPAPSAPSPLAASGDDPFAVAAPAPPASPMAPGPSAGDAMADPFLAAAGGAAPPRSEPSRPERSIELPLTDLSDLEKAPPVPAPAPPPEDAVLAAPPASPARPGPPPLPARPDALALEEADPPAAAGGAAPPMASDFDFNFAGSFDAQEGAGSELELGGTTPAPPASEPMPGPSHPASLLAGLPDEPQLDLPEAPQPPAPPPAPAPRLSAPSPAPAPAPEPSGREPLPSRPRTAGGLRAILLNSLSLLLLLVVSVALFAIWRQGRVDARTFRLSSILAALGHESKEAGAPVVATGVSNGLYETVSGEHILFVRGEVLSRSAAPLGPVKVRVEILNGEQVVARAEALAGAVPTAEELWNVAAPSEIEKLAASLAPRAERVLRPGASAPFVVTFGDYPPDLSGLVFRVATEAGPASN